ncbi:Hypothetical predicted protein [Pelobates cultripes]|uniref:Uncharacterized protein n=1 Tax=Pelobates cultripes TaxID=61616 RepID=A0AAD1WIS0_PELCU|nr:Hypothetical predicted protein [Pelobates cultripes]
MEPSRQTDMDSISPNTPLPYPVISEEMKLLLADFTAPITNNVSDQPQTLSGELLKEILEIDKRSGHIKNKMDEFDTFHNFMADRAQEL